MPLDLLDRLLEHDAWTTGRVLELAQNLTADQLERDFDIGHRTVRGTLLHMVANIETWTDLMAARPVRRSPAGRPSILELRGRFEAASPAPCARPGAWTTCMWTCSTSRPNGNPSGGRSCTSSPTTTSTGRRSCTCSSAWGCRGWSKAMC